MRQSELHLITFSDILVSKQVLSNQNLIVQKSLIVVLSYYFNGYTTYKEKKKKYFFSPLRLPVAFIGEAPLDSRKI